MFIIIVGIVVIVLASAISKLASGSVVGLYTVILDGGRTIIYVSDASKEAETRNKYELRMGN